MKGYISRFSAAKMWNIPCIEAVIGNEVTESEITDITVSDHNARFLINGKKVHSTEMRLPNKSIQTLNGIKVSSPELLFLELANKLSIQRLILLGLQLCSHPPGCPSRAITTKQKLERFISKTAGHRGHRKAMRALKYIENGSASIMESLAYMILTLPHAMGGYGLKGAVFNYEIKLSNNASMRLDQDRCFLDLYYRHAKIGVEYDSFTFHNSPSEQGRDAVRSAVLSRQGIEVLHMYTIQLYNKEACKDFAYNLAAHLGKRIQICTNKFDEMHTLLRALLPDKNHYHELLP
ncbi:MAG: hypothetical protein GX940_10055 [Clostridiaceae bacterium]|jgi:hypothetical protein|nr:hypothetical protein [Clostridiaceae bacterium]